ncbi:neprilysin-1 [Anopheles darlingi]|uniref:neprilysin-1 n=1 Tax=Anopheles darlingi TaxID=43151 RepID=UPI002100221B|nr:neprilysin-1 [Anopheles darlingi]XP_049529718.1 neprilysin-1 [Anopheles darlingi]XP_049529719.1 neprilysin-1 [Anopheles darlingi]XP_049529720.1 neprilysin-1 [Anopheles darlingi]XP_049529721.1 neprilysin-1 [Anopheles darlingi]
MAALKELGEKRSDGGGGNGGGSGAGTTVPVDPVNGYLLRTDADDRTMHPATAISLANADADASGPLLAAPVPVVVNFGGPGMATKTSTLSPAQQQSYGAGTQPDRHRKRSSGSTTVRSPLAVGGGGGGGGKTGPARSITPGRGLFGPRLAGAFRRPTVLGGTMLLVGVLLGVLLVFLVARVRQLTAGGPYCGGVLDVFGGRPSDAEHRTADLESWRRPGHNICLTDECVRTASSLLAAMDRSADPCKDFFQFACGTWNKMHVIPEDRSSISTFEVLADQQQAILKGVLEEPVNKEDNRATKKAKAFYKSCMNLEQIRLLDVHALRAALKRLGGWPVIEKNWTVPNTSIEYLLGKLTGEFDEPGLVELYVGADDKNSSMNIIQIDQLLLALPSRDYYLKESSEGDMKAYHRYMTQIAILMGADKDKAAEELQQIVQFEVRLANATLPEADRHDTSAIYTKITLPELQRRVPQIDWKQYLQTTLGTVRLQPNESIVSYAMPYLVELGKILRSTDRRIVHNYAIWRLVMSIMTHMIDDYQKERVEFRRKLLGIQSERNRWSQCVEWTNKKLGMAVGALFIRDNFNQESKETALTMIHTIREAFNELLADIDWMDDETRAVAKEKADAMNERIGYPDILTNADELEKEYVNLTIHGGLFLENILSILKWEAERNLQLLRKPVDKNKWATEPAVVNAFYNPNKNDIVFPAGILQPLFYSQNFPKSLNYGGIGVVIGHEITHGFDDKGRQFDKDGNMMQWWNNATIKTFRERAQCIIDQYSRYKIDEVGLYMDGRMTQGENIADNGGLKQSYRAYRKWVSQHGSEQDLPGLNMTHDQLFFLNYAQIWCGSMRPEDALTKIRSSVHSPGIIRVIGPLSNSRDFADAYHCPLGSPMNPVSKCSVW